MKQKNIEIFWKDRAVCKDIYNKQRRLKDCIDAERVCTTINSDKIVSRETERHPHVIYGASSADKSWNLLYDENTGKKDR